MTDPIAAPVSRASTWNIANALTVLRLVMVPLFVLALFADDGHTQSWRWVAFGVFAVASYTDRIDGQIARSRNLVTPFGKLVDPIADKALIGAALIGLSLLGDLPWWITVLVMVREIGVTLLRFWVIRHGVIPASRGGKLKTLLQGLAIGFYLLPLSGWAATGRAWLMGAAVAVTVVTGVDYVGRTLTFRQTSDRAAMKRARKAAR
ncbi:MAG: CDP-diacylglycerol--glycerol-3-phosphate 3-phosphatidyltransferase [Actinomycetota bacterium]|nr:CDP-diacylglycerol--glycerol-3-phosphate 3-phosphatidyltransferase [Actinomycetota bacterium]